MEDKSELVSVGVPIVKSVFLEKCIECVLNQTYTNIELIVVNNAKDPKEGNKIEEIVIRFKDEKIRYFRNHSQLPIIENWNKTLSLSEGSFFSILCDDDYWEPGYIETMLRLATKYPAVNVFHSRCLIIDENDKPIDLSPVCPEYEDVTDFIYHRIKEFRMQYLSDFFVRTDAIKELHGFFPVPDAWGSDDLTWFNLAIPGGIAYSPETLCHYRESTASVTNTMKIKNKISATKIYIDSIHDILDKLKGSSGFNPIIITLIYKQLDELKKTRLLYYEAEYMRKKFMLNKFFYEIVVMNLKLKYKLLKHY